MVSVVMACRNAATTLGVQLEALSRQECPFEWNVVISDNGSSDGSAELARSYSSRLPGLVVVDSSEHPGAGYARNVGAAATQAPLLVFCDADDEAAPGWLAAMVAALQQDQFVAGRLDSGALNGLKARRSRALQQDDRLQESPFGPDLPHAGAGNLGVARQVFLSVGGFDPAMSCLEDTDLCWRIQRTGIRLVFCPDAVMHVRLRSSLRTMWAQGRAYGAASALLEHRYGTAVPSGARTSKPGPRRPHPRFGRLSRILALVRDQRSLGGLLWTLGWHIGHRSWQPQSAPPIPTPIRTPIPPAEQNATRSG